MTTPPANATPAPAPSAPSPIHLARTTVVRRHPSGETVLVGGTPTVLLRLAAGAEPAAVAGTLVDRGIAVPDVSDAEPATDVELARLAIVVPVCDPPVSLFPLKAALHDLLRAGALLVIVDDGSDEPLREPAGALLIRHETPRGPAAARNAGIRAARRRGRNLVALLDADTVPQPGWLDPLLAHTRPECAGGPATLVAPRIVAAHPARSGVAGYETARSALDMGPDPAPVRPRSVVPYVPSAALLLDTARLAAVDGQPAAVDPDAPFDESLRVAEDVDLCWRLAASGAPVRYEPAARVAHRHRLDLAGMLRRRAYYGSGASHLAAAHGNAVAPAVFSGHTLAVAALAWGPFAGFPSRRSRPVAAISAAAISAAAGALVAADSGRRVHRATGDARLAALLTARSVSGAFWQLASAALRPYWPMTALLATLAAASGRARPTGRVLATAAVAEGLHHWWSSREPGAAPANDPVTHLVLRRLDDLAYGTGVWRSALRARSAAALRPDITWLAGTRGSA